MLQLFPTTTVKQMQHVDALVVSHGLLNGLISMFVLDICKFLMVAVHPLAFPVNGPTRRRLIELVFVTGPID